MIIGRPRSLTGDQVAEARRLYESGATCGELGKHFCCDPTTVSRAISEAGLKQRRRGPRPGCHGNAKLDRGRVIEIRRRVAAGEQRIRLAEEYGVSRALVSLIVKNKVWRDVA